MERIYFDLLKLTLLNPENLPVSILAETINPLVVLYTGFKTAKMVYYSHSSRIANSKRIYYDQWC